MMWFNYNFEDTQFLLIQYIDKRTHLLPVEEKGEGEYPSTCRILFPYLEMCTPIGGSNGHFGLCLENLKCAKSY